MLAFATPVRLPRLRLHTGDSPPILPPPLGSIASRARDGITIDGAFLRAVPQAEALRRLSAGGVNVGGDWRAWLRSHPRDDAQRGRKAAEQHYQNVTGNLLLVWVLVLILGFVALIIGVNVGCPRTGPAANPLITPVQQPATA